METSSLDRVGFTVTRVPPGEGFLRRVKRVPSTQIAVDSTEPQAGFPQAESTRINPDGLGEAVAGFPSGFNAEGAEGAEGTEAGERRNRTAFFAFVATFAACRRGDAGRLLENRHMTLAFSHSQTKTTNHPFRSFRGCRDFGGLLHDPVLASRIRLMPDKTLIQQARGCLIGLASNAATQWAGSWVGGTGRGVGGPRRSRNRPDRLCAGR